MASGRTISIRLGLDGAVELKQQLEAAGVQGGAAMDKLRASLERLNAQDTGSVVAALARVKQAAADAQTAVGQAQANSFAGVKDATDYKSRAADVASYGVQLDALRAKFNPLFAVSKQYETQLDEISAAEKIGAISASEAAAARETATAAFARSSAPITASSAALKTHTEVTGASSAAMRGLGIQAVQAFSGLATGQPVLTTLIQQGHQVVDQSLAMGTGLSGIGTAAKGLLNAIGGLPTVLGVGVVGGLAAVSVAANENANRLADLRQALRLTHDDYSSLADAVDATAKRVAASSTLTRSGAEDIAKAIAGSRYLGDFSRDLDGLTKSAADYARVAGVDGVAAGRLFRQAIDDPATAAQALAGQGLPSMNAALLRTIDLLAKSGQSGDATRLVFDAIRQSTQGATQDVSPLGAALHGLEERLYGARDGGKSLAQQTGDLLNSFLALEVRGLDKLIEGFDKFIGKAEAAAKAGAAAVQAAAPNGVDEYGRPIPSATPTTSASGPAISQVDAKLQPIVDAAAKQYQLDTDLLARLQLAENRTPASYDPSGIPIYRSSGENSPNAAVGPFQVKPSTYAGLGFTGSAVDNTNNSNAAAALFSHLLDKYGDVKIAVLAYHDGETLMDKVLASGGAVSNSQEALAEALKVTQGYTGTGRAVTASSAPPVSAGTDIVVSSAKPIGATAQAGALPESVQRLLGGGSDGTQFASAQDAAARIEEVTRAIIDLRGAGETAGPNMDRLQAILGKAREAAYGAVSPFENLTRAAQDQLGPLQAQSGAARTVAEAVNEARIALQSRGQDLSDVQADQVRAAALEKLGLEFNDTVRAIDLQIDAQSRINAAYAATGGNVLEVTARTQAEAKARETAIPGTQAYADQVAKLTAKNVELAQSQLALQQIQQNRGVSDNIAYIQAETATLGMNEDARTRVLAVMKAELEEHAKYGAVLPAEAQQYIDLIGKQADYAAALKNQQASLQELTGFFDNTFNTISDAIVSAFATGEQSAVKFKDVVGSVEKAIEAEFLKLALLNPLKNFLFGSTSPTLSSVGGIIGKIFGGSTGSDDGRGTLLTSTVGLDPSEYLNTVDGPVSFADTATKGSGLGLLDSAGSIGTLAKGIDYLSGGHLISDITGGIEKAIGFTPGESIGAYVSGLIGETPTAAAGAISSVGASAGQTVATAAIDDFATAGGASAASEAGVGVIGSAVNTISQALPYIGTAISVITDIAQGNYRGAGLVAGGALVGSIFGPVGTAVGAAIGGLVDALLPNHPKNPYQDTEVDVAGGHLVAGRQVSQLEDTTAAAQSVADYSAQIDKFLSATGTVITNIDSAIGHLGNNITGLDQVDSVDKLFSKLQFANDPSDTSNFGVAKGALAGMSFSTFADLGAELQKIAGFSDAVSAVGIQLAAVGKDLTSIQIASVETSKQSFGTVRNAAGQDIEYRNNLGTALNADLPGQTFADVGALDAEIAKVNNFVNGTLPQLLTPVEKTTSSIIDQATAIQKTYGDAIEQSKQYALDNTAVLQTAEEEALAIVRRTAVEQIKASATQVADRYAIATYGQQAAPQQALDNFDIQAQQQQESLRKLWAETYGDVTLTSKDYLQAMVDLEKTLGAERVAAAQQAADAVAAGLLNVGATVYSIRARQLAAGGDQRDADLITYDIKAAQERASVSKSLTDFYGQAYASSAEYEGYMTELTRVQQAERLAIVQKYGDQTTAAGAQALTSAKSSVTSLFGSITDYVHGLQTGSNSALSPLSAYDLASNQFNAVSGAALAGDATSAGKLTSYADALLSASRDVNGSGAAYAADFQRVLDALQNVTGVSDALTQSFMQLQFQQQNDLLSGIQDAIGTLNAQMSGVRQALNQSLAQQAQRAAA